MGLIFSKITRWWYVKAYLRILLFFSIFTRVCTSEIKNSWCWKVIFMITFSDPISIYSLSCSFFIIFYSWGACTYWIGSRNTQSESFIIVLFYHFFLWLTINFKTYIFSSTYNHRILYNINKNWISEHIVLLKLEMIGKYITNYHFLA